MKDKNCKLNAVKWICITLTSFPEHQILYVHVNKIKSFTDVALHTLTLARGHLILPADPLISNLLTRIGDFKLKKIQVCMQSDQAEFDPGEPNWQLLA